MTLPSPLAGVELIVADDAEVLERALVQRAGGTGLGHRCPECGSDAHGQPYLKGSGAVWWVSVTHAGGVHVGALTQRGPVGVDAEPVGAARPEVATVALAQGEASDDLTATWVRKEAVSKALGRGLAIDPRVFRVDRQPVVLGADEVVVADVDFPGYRVAVALSCGSGGTAGSSSQASSSAVTSSGA